MRFTMSCFTAWQSLKDLGVTWNIYFSGNIYETLLVSVLDENQKHFFGTRIFLTTFYHYLWRQLNCRLDSSSLCILCPGSCQFDAKSINEKPVNIFTQNFVCMLANLLVHIWVKNKQTSKKLEYHQSWT